MGPLCSRQFQDTIQVNSPSIVSYNKSESIFLPITGIRDRGSSSETGSGKGTRSGNSRLLFSAISYTKKEWKVTSGNRSFSAKSIYKKTTIQNGDSQIGTSIDIDLTDAYLNVPIHPRSRKYLRFMFKGQVFQFRALPFGPKSMDFHQTDGSYSITHAPT